MITIRNATYKDAPSIKSLLAGLGYRATNSKLIMMLETTFTGKEHEVLVAIKANDIIGFIAVHYVPQLGVDGDLALVSYLAVDEDIRREGIGRALEGEVVERAMKRFCDRVELHCSIGRTDADRFYKKLGYDEYPTYFCKRLVANDRERL